MQKMSELCFLALPQKIIFVRFFWKLPLKWYNKKKENYTHANFLKYMSV